MKLLLVYRGFDGRIGRAVWWSSFFFLAVAACGLYYLLHKIFGAPVPTTSHQLAQLKDPHVQMVLAYRGSWIAFVVTALFASPALAIFSKRLRDRGWSDWLRWIVAVPFIAGPIIGILGYGWQLGDAGNGVMMAKPTLLASAIGLIASMAAFWMLVECGFRPGVFIGQPEEDAQPQRKPREPIMSVGQTAME